MRPLPSRPFALITLTVAFATLCALALPEGNGGRDSVVRLTRGGLQRLGCPDAFDHHDPEAIVAPENEPLPQSARIDGARTPAVTVSSSAMTRPTWQATDRSWPAPAPRVVQHPGHAISGRAPPFI